MKTVELTTTDGTEITLKVAQHRNGEYFIPIPEMDKPTPEPEFKAGDWIVGVGYYNPIEVSRLNKIEDYEMWYDDGRGEVMDTWRNDNGPYIRLATKDEIETHLRKIADEKYVGKMVKCLVSGVYRVTRFSEYRDRYGDEPDDRLFYKAEGMCEEEEVTVYLNGKWAEIVPSKKKLPKTKEELIEVLTEYFGAFNIKRHPNYDNFLDQYED